MKLEDIKRELEEHDLEYRGRCHDCNVSVSILISVVEDGAITIEGGAIYKVKQLVGDEIFFKCDECFKNDKILRNYQECEVYSRVVGYLRPIRQWNRGKKAEYEMRKDFINTKGK